MSDVSKCSCRHFPISGHKCAHLMEAEKRIEKNSGFQKLRCIRGHFLSLTINFAVPDNSLAIFAGEFIA